MKARKVLVGSIVAAVLLTVPIIALAKPCDSETTVPGHCDKGGTVVGHYTSLFAYEGEYGTGFYPQENWYWDLGDGRVWGTVDSVDFLDQDRLTVCDYVVNYRGDFGVDPSLDNGWIQNHINCSGYDDNNHYNYLIVHETDPRYRGDPEWAIWGTWEYKVLTISGFGNLVRPDSHVGG